MNLELFYSKMANNDWGFVYDFMKKNNAYFKKNLLELERISGFIACEYVRYIPTEKPVLILTLSQKMISLNKSGWVLFTVPQLIDIENVTLDCLTKEDRVSFAKSFCVHSPRANILEKELTEKVDRREPVEVIKPKTNKAFSRKDWLSPLFKSSQELEFYQSLKSSFPNHFIYPNVALSNIFNFDSLRNSINAKERDYFFKAVIDFVVYDPTDLHVPNYFFEVDSHYHDNPAAKVKDSMKDNIFLSANIPLHRVRLLEYTNTPRHEFTAKIKKLLEEA
jgi:hypothetical protein